MKICPSCGGKRFCVTAHVTQDWLVDENEFFEGVICDCIDVTHKPNDDDIWECYECGYDAPGKEFNVKE